MKKILIGAILIVIFCSGVTPARADSTADLEKQLEQAKSLVANLQAQVNNLEASPRDTTPWVPTNSTLSSCSIPSIDLALGSYGPAVRELQIFLNQSKDTQIASTGPGAPGQETDYFGNLTARAVSRFQEKYAINILSPLGLAHGTGYWGASSRAQARASCTSASTTPNTANDFTNDGLPELSQVQQQSDQSIPLGDLPADTASSLADGLSQIVGETGDQEFLTGLTSLINERVGKEKLAQLEAEYSPRQVAGLVFVLPSVQAGISQLLSDYITRESGQRN